MEVVSATVAMETTILDFILLYTYICLEICEAVELNGSYAKDYKVHSLPETKYTSINMVPVHRTRHGHKASNTQFAIRDSVSNMLEIQWINSSTDSISIGWSPSKNYNLTGYVLQSTVEYFPTGGRFTSHPLAANIREYSITNLDANTLYTICVHMIEVFGHQNRSSITHSNCVKINTINYIRRESLVIMIITLGYYVFMGLLGYTQWKRKIWDFQSRKRRRQKEATNTSAMRWKELVEKERLVPKPGCSTEFENT